MMPAITSPRHEAISIGELSRKTGVKIETIRYYERIKMLPEPARTEGGRRIYRKMERRMLLFIHRGRELGFSLNEIRELLELRAPGRGTCNRVRDVASAHLAAVRAKLSDLHRMEVILAEGVAQCDAGAAPHCPMLDVLEVGS